MNTYLHRIMDDTLPFLISATGGLLIKGPKWCGKSTTAERHAKSIVYMQDERKKELYISLAKNDPQRLLKGDVPRLIDEWQIVPTLWDSVRHEIDLRGGELGQFLLTGSAVPPEEEKIKHSGAGRIATCIMRPMSLFESGESNGEVSLKELFEGNACFGEAAMELEDYAFATCRGGWPAAVGKNRRVALKLVDNFYQTLVSSDMSRVDGVKRSPERVKLLMSSYARLVTTQANNETIRLDMATHESSSVGADTIVSYLNALRKLYVIEDLPPWAVNLRSKVRIRTTETRHFVDPSLACAALGASPELLVGQLRTFGCLFEELAVRDLRVYAEAMDGTVYHYHDSNGLECDAIVQLRDGRYGLVEIKLYNPDRIEEGAANLVKLASLVNTNEARPPSFLAVVTGTKTAYKREDGVHIIPLGCLRN